MTITDELIKPNGHARAALSNTPTITLSSGYTIGLRRQPGDVMAKAQAAAEKELEASRPVVPTQSMETEPGVWRDIPNEHNEDYQQALKAWKSEVNARFAQLLLLIIERIGVVFEVDQQRLSELRETYALLGIDLPENDRSAYLGYVLAPTNDDQARLFAEVFGKGFPQEAQVKLHQHLFPGNLETHTP